MIAPPIDVRPEEWRILRDILRQYVAGREVWAFGSRTRGAAKTYSDLDLAIIGDRPLDDIGALRDALCESDLPFRVDIVDWAATAESFRRIIEAGHVVIQTSSAPAG